MRYILITIFLLCFPILALGDEKLKDENFIDLSAKDKEVKKVKKKDSNFEKKPLKKDLSSKALPKIVKRGKLESPSLGSIGVETIVNKKFGLNVWSKFTAKNATININYIPDVISSQILQNYLINIYASKSIPPSGNSNEVVKFLESKLHKIAMNSNTKQLEEIVIQLPNSPRWSRWKKWYVEYNLMRKNDKKACNQVKILLDSDTSISLQKANIICLLINQKTNEAKFIHDLLKSQNLLDELYLELFNHIIMESNPKDIKLKKTEFEPIHIVMLDILKYPIKANMIANLGPEYSESLIDLIYVEPETRSFLLDRIISTKKIDRDKIIQIYQSVLDPNQNEQKALLNLSQKSNGINRANVWLSSLKIEDESKKVEYILKVLDIESNFGRFRQSLDLYIPILNLIDIKSLPNNLNKIIKYLNILYNPSKYPEENLSKLILLPKKSIWDLSLIKKYKAWGYVGFAEAQGMLPPAKDWNSLLKEFQPNLDNKNKSNRWSRNDNYKNFVLRRSIKSKSEKGHNIHAILLIARLFNDNSLSNFDLSNLIVVETAMKLMGLDNLAKKIRTEVLVAKFTNFNVNNVK